MNNDENHEKSIHTLQEGYENDCFTFSQALAKTSEFMTITTNCTDFFKKYCPPQFI